MTAFDVNGRPLLLSPSMIERSAKCQLQVHWFYRMKMKLPPGFVRELGTAVHYQTLSVDQPDHDETGVWHSIEELKQGLTDHLAEVTPEIPETDDAVVDAGSKEDAYAIAQKQGFALLDAYDRDRTVLSGRAYEAYFELPFAGEQLHGYIDCDVAPDSFKDLKTRSLAKKFSRRVSQVQVDESLSFATYAAAKAKLEGVPEQTVTGVYAYSLPAGATIEPMSTQRGAVQHELLEDYAARLYRAIESDSLLPVDKSSAAGWVCSSKWCGAYDSVCPYGARSRVSV